MLSISPVRLNRSKYFLGSLIASNSLLTPSCSTIGDNCWLTSCANISGVVTVGSNCFFAVNSTVAHGIKLGDECFIGANALITKSTNNGEVFLTESTKAFRLNSRQFLRVSRFSDL